MKSPKVEADAPAPILNPIGDDAVKFFVNGDNKIRYERRFVFGKNGKIYFPVSDYHLIKRLFDDFYKIDDSSISLRQIQE